MKQIIKYPGRTHQKICPDVDTNTDLIRVRIAGQD